jgi:hypothetical protein
MGCVSSAFDMDIQEKDWTWSDGDYQGDFASIPENEKSFGIEFVNNTGHKILITHGNP